MLPAAEQRREHFAASSAAGNTHFEYIKMPGTMIDVETVIEDIGPIPIVHFISHQIGQAHLPIFQFRKRQKEPALCLVVGIVDNDDVSTVITAGPGTRD